MRYANMTKSHYYELLDELHSHFLSLVWSDSTAYSVATVLAAVPYNP